MTTRERITADLVAAMKAREAAKVSALRMLQTAIKNAEIDAMKPLEEKDVVDAVSREVKKLRDGLESFTAGGRADLAEGVRAEIAVLSAYLPAQMDDAALAALVQERRAALEAEAPLTEKDFGKLMKDVMAAAKGAADGQKVSAAVKAALAGK